jgi:integrase/recombinase XerD
MSGAFYGYGRCPPERVCRKLEAWPEEDRRLWLAALTPGDLLEPGGERARYRAISNRKVEGGYGRYLTFLAGRGVLESMPPADRIAPALVAEYVKTLQQLGNRGQTILARLQDLYEAALVMGPKSDWSWIRRIASRVRAWRLPAREKASRLVGSDDLLNLGFELMAKAGTRLDERVAAIEFRDGLMIAFGALCPLRLKNAVALELRRHVIKIGEEWWLVIPASETKTGAPIEQPWPECLTAALEEWCERRRPVLCAVKRRGAPPPGDALWISSHGSPMKKETIYARIVGRTTETFGKPINPHLFRDIAATTLADVDPEHARIAAQVLGHRKFRTTERHYLHADRMKAVRQHQQLIRRLRDLIDEAE